MPLPAFLKFLFPKKAKPTTEADPKAEAQTKKADEAITRLERYTAQHKSKEAK